MSYDTGYPKKKIGGGNPYQCCAACGISEPQINGDINNHLESCSYRKEKELKDNAHRLYRALLRAHMDIAAGSGMIVNGAVVCACSDCKLARMYLGEDN